MRFLKIKPFQFLSLNRFLFEFLNSQKKFVKSKFNFQCQTVGGYHQEQEVEWSTPKNRRHGIHG